MAGLVEHVASGAANGGLYALLAAALVVAYRATGVLNFAQGELATLSAFVCLALQDHGWALWPAFAATVVLSFAGGALVQRALLAPLQAGPPIWLVAATVGLALAADGLDTWIWGDRPRPFRSPFSARTVHLGAAAVPVWQLGVLGLTLAGALLAGLLAGRGRFGLGLRAAAESPGAARRVGIRVGAVQAAAWGLAAATGAAAAVLAAPSLRLDPDMLQSAFLYAIAAAVLAGLDSVAGATVGALAIGVGVSLVGAYAHGLGGELRVAIALAVLAVAVPVRLREDEAAA